MTDMQKTELRKKLHQLLDTADDMAIEARLKTLSQKKLHSPKAKEEITIDDVFAIIEEILNSLQTVVGFTPEGSAITKETLIEEMRQAEKELERGEFISLESLKKEAKNW
jgi:hypothetical protein